MKPLQKESIHKELRDRDCISPIGELLIDKIHRKTNAIIPAAGKGSRLDYYGPKVLFPYRGKTILQVLHGELKDIVESFCLVINPDQKQAIQKFLDISNLEISLAEQNKPTGMGDAVLAASSKFNKNNMKNEDYIIVWGDQVSLSGSTVLATLLYHQCVESESALTFPTCWLEDPYIHFEKNNNREITSLFQRREGDTMPAIGESDCGVFIVKGTVLFDKLKQFKLEAAVGAKTREFNFLPFIVWLAKNGHKVVALPIAEPLETKGINTLDDAEYIKSKKED